MSDDKVTTAAGLNEEQARTSTAAILTYALLAIWVVTKGCVFALAFKSAHQAGTPGIDLSAAMMGIIGQVITAEQTLLVAAVSYWVGSSQGSKNSAAIIGRIAAGSTAQDPKDAQ